MSTRAVRGAAALFFLLYTVGVTWPGAVPLNRIRPFVLGLPLSLAWVALWLVLSFGVLLWLDRHETADEDADAVLDAALGRSEPGAGEDR